MTRGFLSGGNDVLGRWEIGLSGAEADDVLAGCFQGFRAGVDLQCRRLRYVENLLRQTRVGDGPTLSL